MLLLVLVLAAHAQQSFRVWAPHATAAQVVSPNWTAAVNMTRDGSEWETTVLHARPGDHYKFLFAGQAMGRLDPRCQARQGDFSLVYNVSAYQWRSGPFVPSGRRRIVYELHVPSFSPAGTLDGAAAKLPYLASLGVTLVELMPIADFSRGAAGWGYNPSGLITCTMAAFGGANALKRFVDKAHGLGLGVVLDVVFNHFDPANVLLAYDGYGGATGNGIYFYEQQGYAETFWGPRPDYASPPVAAFLHDSLRTFVSEYRIDGFRFDSTVCIRKPARSCWTSPFTNAAGVAFLQNVTSSLGAAFFTTAEDDQGDAAVTAPIASGGLGFGSQWGYQGFFYGFFGQLTRPTNEHLNATLVAALLQSSIEGNRVLFTENHDMASNQNKGRVPAVVDPGGSAHKPSYWAAKKAMMGLAAVVVGNGVPMIFQGQELLTYAAFLFPFPPKIDWTLAAVNSGIVREVADLLHLPLRDNGTVVLQVADSSVAKVVSILNNGVLCVLNFDVALPAFALHKVPRDGTWRRVFDGDSPAYFPAFNGFGSSSFVASGGTATLALAQYSMNCFQ
jgi:1,4-alpha-glucan branching enzyme